MQTQPTDWEQSPAKPCKTTRFVHAHPTNTYTVARTSRLNPSLLLLVQVIAGLIAAAVALRTKFFQPQLPAFVPRKPGEGGEIAPALLLGAFAAYSVSALLAWVAMLLSGQAQHQSPPEPRLEMLAHTAVLTMLLSIPAVVAIAWWSRQLVLQPFDPSPRRLPRLVGESLMWALVVLPMVMALGAAVSHLCAALGHPADPTAHNLLKRIIEKTDEPQWWRWCLIASAVIGAPIVEEFCYRALLQRGLMTLTRAVWPAVIFTSAVFTIMHAGSVPDGSFWAAAGLLFPLSVCLGLLFARTGSVITPILVHSAFNALNILLAFWQVY